MVEFSFSCPLLSGMDAFGSKTVINLKPIIKAISHFACSKAQFRTPFLFPVNIVK